MAGIVSRSSSLLLRSAAKFAKSGATESLKRVRLTRQMHTSCRSLLSSNTHLHNYNCKRWASEQASNESIDEEFSKFLTEEIQREKETEKARPEISKIDGWDSELKGTDIILTQTRKNEKIVVKLNIVDSVDVAEEDMHLEEEKDSPQMESRPPFVVEIHKNNSKQIVTFECQFSNPDEMGGDPEQEETPETLGDKFQILEIASHFEEVKDTNYSVQTSTMDANMYELCMDYLDERGIDEQFMDQLVQFCTQHEHKQYISFLGDFKKFIDTK